MQGLVSKYNVPSPRYTSYPTVPYWDLHSFSGDRWLETVQQSFQETNNSEGLSLYIHLPFCEQMCTFCGCHKRITTRHEVELPYLNAVLKEWELYLKSFSSKPLIKELHLGGGTPTFFSPENLRLLIEGILANAERTADYEFSFEGHPNNTSYEHLSVLYQMGFRRVSFGVQDYNFKIQKAINRVQPFEHVRRVTEWAREIGYTSVGHDLIFGLPHQTVGDIEKTVMMTGALKPDRIALYSYAHVPWLKGNGQRGFREEDLPAPEAKRRQYERGKELLTKLGYAEIGMDHFALPADSLYNSMVSGKLHRNFMGYTAMKTSLMIGLGVSSISDSWYGFAQNVKSIEEYQHLVSNDIIPIFRGHILTDEDQLIRRHILNLMCQYETAWGINAPTLPELPAISERLREMIQDGLLVMSPNSLEVTEKGRVFIRNICMAFDLHLHRKVPETQMFSMSI